MTSQQRKLGIIAGGGAIPAQLIRHCQEQGRDFFVLAIEGNADKNTVNENVPHQWIRIGQAGTGFKRFAEEKVQDVIMIGTIRRPSFFDLVKVVSFRDPVSRLSFLCCCHRRFARLRTALFLFRPSCDCLFFVISEQCRIQKAAGAEYDFTEPGAY